MDQNTSRYTSNGKFHYCDLHLANLTFTAIHLEDIHQQMLKYHKLTVNLPKPALKVPELRSQLLGVQQEVTQAPGQCNIHSMPPILKFCCNFAACVIFITQNMVRVTSFRSPFLYQHLLERALATSGLNCKYKGDSSCQNGMESMQIFTYSCRP